MNIYIWISKATFDIQFHLLELIHRVEHEIINQQTLMVNNRCQGIFNIFDVIFQPKSCTCVRVMFYINMNCSNHKSDKFPVDNFLNLRGGKFRHFFRNGCIWLCVVNNQYKGRIVTTDIWYRATRSLSYFEIQAFQSNLSFL